jgi:hypothetical protein
VQSIRASITQAVDKDSLWPMTCCVAAFFCRVESPTLCRPPIAGTRRQTDVHGLILATRHAHLEGRQGMQGGTKLFKLYQTVVIEALSNKCCWSFVQNKTREVPGALYSRLKA